MQVAQAQAPAERVAEHLAPAMVPQAAPVVASAPIVAAAPVVAASAPEPVLPEPVRVPEPAPVVVEPAPSTATDSPASSSVAASLSTAASLPDFQTTIAKIMDSHPLLAILDDARPLVWRSDEVVLGFEKDTKLEMAEHKREGIKDAFVSVLGANISIDLKLDQAARPADPSRWSRHEAQLQASTDDKLSRKREAEEHPARQLLKAAFGNVSFQSPTLLDEVS